MRTRNFPTVYTLSYTPKEGGSSADVTAQVINTGRITVTESGILWGTGSLDIDTYTGKISTGNINGQPFTLNISSLPESGSISVVAYAKTQAGTFYGKEITIPQQKVVSPFTNKTWMSYNLGATALANVTVPRGDVNSYGHLYQWGRGNDGHQIILPLKSATYDVNRVAISGSAFSGVTGLLTNYNSASSSFVNTTNNWFTNSRNDLWQGLNGLNNPCPAGFRVPTFDEAWNEAVNFSPSNAVGALNSFLRLPMAGLRTNGGVLGTNYFNYDIGRYWTSTSESNNFAKVIGFNSSEITTGLLPSKSWGYSIRCIFGESSSGGSSNLSYINLNYSTTGNMFPNIPVSGVTQTITANVSTIGTYDISTNTVNGVSFAGKGTFTGATGVKEIVLTASGTPLEPKSTIFRLNTMDDIFVDEFTRIVSPSSTNGTAVVDSYTPVGSTTGEMSSGNKIIVNVPSSIGTVVSQTFTANVSTPGTYNINAINNGVTFASSGTFTTTGPQNIVLTASGIPTSAGDYTFTSNTNPSAIFSNTAITGDPTSGGTATIDFTNSVTAGAPVLLTAEQTAENARKLVYMVESSTYNPPFIGYRIVNVTKAGSYNLNMSDNRDGVTLRLAGSGIFTTTGWQLMTLYYIGAPKSGPPSNHAFYFPNSSRYQGKDSQ